MGNVSGSFSGLRTYGDGEVCSIDLNRDMPVESYHQEQEATIHHPQNHTPVAFPCPDAFTSQVRTAPLNSSYGWMPSSADDENFHTKERIPTMIVWTHGGNSVAVEGSWDNWSTRIPLEKSGDDYMIVKHLHPGVYHYRFAVDGRWAHDETLPWTNDVVGRFCNVLDVKDYVPEATKSREVLESPPSPDSSYNNILDEDFFAKEPPLAPQILHSTILNIPQPATEMSFPRPLHTVLDHFYIRETRDNPPVVATGTTQRFRDKYVTVELYRPARKSYK